MAQAIAAIPPLVPALGLASSSPATAQSAVVQVFDVGLRSTADRPAKKEPNNSGFVLHEPGRLLRGPSASPLDGRAVVATGMTSATVIQPAASRCFQGMVPPPRLLATPISVARRTFWPAIAAVECRFGLPTGLMDSVVLAESRYNPSIVSPAGAVGLAQLMPATALELGVVDRLDPLANVEAGARYLRTLIATFGGNVPLALAAYNAGPAAVRRSRGIPANGETPGYVQRVLAYWTEPGIGPMSPALPVRQTAQMLGFGPVTTN